MTDHFLHQPSLLCLNLHLSRPNADAYIQHPLLNLSCGALGRAPEREMTRKHFENYQIVASSCHGC